MILLELACGVGPAHDRASAWLDRHPGVCLAVMLLAALACVTADGWFA